MQDIKRKKPEIIDLSYINKTVNPSNITAIVQNIKDKITAVDLRK